MHLCFICNNKTYNFNFPIKTCIAPMGINLSPLKLLRCPKCGHLQKKIDKIWLKNMNNLYEKKYIFIGKHITVKKNKVYDRNQLITQLLNKFLKLPKKGKMLDIGCGAGHFIKSFKETKEKWDIFAHDLTNLNKKIISKYKIKKFFTGDVERIKGKFDFISMNHVVEHLTEPRRILIKVNKILKDNGNLIIRLPNIKTVHNDLTVLDHCSHFTKDSLENILKISGFKVIKFFNKFNPAELFVIATKSSKKENNKITFSKLNKKEVKNLAWLENVCKKIERVNGKNLIGLFGVGTSAFYLYARLKNKISFFVDEDTTKIGNTYYNKKIYGAKDAPKNSRVYIAVHNKSSSFAIKKRLENKNKSIKFLLG